MLDEAKTPITADELPPLEHETQTPDEAETVVEQPAETEVKPIKHKKTAKRKTPVKRSLKPKKMPVKAPIVEDEIVPTINLDPTISVLGKNTTEKDEMRPDINASIESIYGSQNGNDDMGALEIKKTGWLAKIFGWVLIVGLVGCIVALGAWWYVGPNIKSLGDNVNINLTASENITLGATTTLTIAYENNESVAIRNTVLQAYYPNGFVILDTSIPSTNVGKNEWLLGTIPAHEKRTVTITGRMYAPINYDGTFRALLSYRPDGFESTFQKNTHIKLRVMSSPLSLAISSPAQSVLGITQPYFLTVSKPPSFTAKPLILNLKFPEGFSISSSSVPFKNSGFVVSDKLFSTSTNSANILFNGAWNNIEGDSGVLNVDLILTPPDTTSGFSVASATATTTLVKNEASISMAINGSTKLDTVQPGDVLATTLQISNNGKTVLKGGVLKLVYEGPAIAKTSAYNWANLNDSKNGTVTGEAVGSGIRRGTIVWTTKQIPALATLAPGQSIAVDVALPIRDAEAFDWNAITTSSYFSVISSADFVDENKKNVHVESSQIRMKLRTDVAIEIRDSVSATNDLLHQITWVVTNNLHPLKDITLTATLYGDINFTAPTTTPAGSLTYDKKTKVLVWTVPEMPVGVDVLAMPFVVTINKPNPTQTSLQSKVRFKATDAVTSDTVELLGDEVLLGQ